MKVKSRNESLMIHLRSCNVFINCPIKIFSRTYIFVKNLHQGILLFHKRYERRLELTIFKKHRNNTFKIQTFVE